MSFKNSRKDGFLSKIPTISIFSENNDLSKRCKFNFSYFDRDQDAGQDFKDWNQDNIVKLIDKLINYSKDSLEHWQREKIGRGSGHVLEVYGDFPKKSDFSHPKHVPIEAKWARFRIDSSTRLIGFVTPETCHDMKQGSSEWKFCKNTFYIVFLDDEHRFYKTK
ncbi:hypothetical protein [Marinomonas ostreistagni]|uniref:hypothetical protein n=1 Tax=Marinomonas ostreistagni TaxID=359209 RepID=UPI0019521CD8|nr:hypothetical protein [Marinomonas ostreistagni]MBM6550762.1 hypothetical protein [Marinomonas ostreistagni]